MKTSNLRHKPVRLQQAIGKASSLCAVGTASPLLHNVSSQPGPLMVPRGHSAHIHERYGPPPHAMVGDWHVGSTKGKSAHSDAVEGRLYGRGQLTSASKETEMTLVKVPSIVWGRENWYRAFNFRSRKGNPLPTAMSPWGLAACL